MVESRDGSVEPILSVLIGVIHRLQSVTAMVG